MGEVAPVFTHLTVAAVDAAPPPPPHADREGAASPDDAVTASVAASLTLKLGHPVREVAGPPELVKLLAWALRNPHLRVTPRDCSRAAPRSVLVSHGKPFLLGVNVTTGARRGPDDEVYAAVPAIQAHVPRGLTLALMVKDGVAALEPVTVHPTAKFGGDNDDEATGDVAVMDDAALAREVAGAARYIVTEKANGEMFTATVIKTYASDAPRYWVAAGSKNNKFALWCNGDGLLVLPNGYETCDATAWLRATWAPDAPAEGDAARVEWDRRQLWGEMLEEFVRTLRAPLLAYLSATSYTACAEFESYLHPHLECFALRHRAIRYFAMTARTPGATTHAVFTAGARLEQLRLLRDDMGVRTVAWEEVPTLDLAALRQRVWRQDGKEGVVILALAADDTILRMIKLKSVWYVVNRGLRERFRGWKPEAPLRDAEAAAAKKLDEKLAIFARYPAAGGLLGEVRAAYAAYAAAFARVVHAHCGEAAWRARFDFDFPGVMAEARAKA